MTLYRFNSLTKKTGIYADKGEIHAGQDKAMPTFANEAELAATSISAVDMVFIHNQFAVNQVNRFSDRTSAVRRTWAAITKADAESAPEEFLPPNEEVVEDAAEDVTEQVVVPAVGEATGSAATAEAPAVTFEEPDNGVPVPPVSPKVQRGRKPGVSDKYRDKMARPISKDNPRRKGSHGWKSFQILLGKPEGISVEAFVAAGGRMKDLAWDIQYKHAEWVKNKLGK